MYTRDSSTTPTLNQAQVSKKTKKSSTPRGKYLPSATTLNNLVRNICWFLFQGGGETQVGNKKLANNIGRCTKTISRYKKELERAFIIKKRFVKGKRRTDVKFLRDSNFKEFWLSCVKRCPKFFDNFDVNKMAVFSSFSGGRYEQLFTTFNTCKLFSIIDLYEAWTFDKSVIDIWLANMSSSPPKKDAKMSQRISISKSYVCKEKRPTIFKTKFGEMSLDMYGQEMIKIGKFSPQVTDLAVKDLIWYESEDNKIHNLDRLFEKVALKHHGKIKATEERMLRYL
jgi:hypothetical protein